MITVLPTLYSRTSKGDIQMWIVEVDGDKFRTRHGRVDGKIVENKWRKAAGTNIGRANERTPEEQALFMAEALWKKRVETSYHEKIEDIDKPAIIECMLAKKWEDRKKKLKESDWPVYTQPKLDGIRCIMTKEGMFSRNGKRFTSCRHVERELESFFDKFPEMILDGELYCNKLNNDFNKISGWVRKQTLTDKQRAEVESTLQYWVYDVIDDEADFSLRCDWLYENLPRRPANDHWIVVGVPTHVCYNEEEISKFYERWVEEGYEGSMVRLERPYEQKRSDALLKHKSFDDAEYEIVEIVEGTGNRAGMAGWAIMKNSDGSTFKSNIKGKWDFLKELYEKRDEMVGKQATIQYFGLSYANSEAGIPRFPYLIAIRDYE